MPSEPQTSSLTVLGGEFPRENDSTTNRKHRNTTTRPCADTINRKDAITTIRLVVNTETRLYDDTLNRPSIRRGRSTNKVVDLPRPFALGMNTIVKS